MLCDDPVDGAMNRDFVSFIVENALAQRVILGCRLGNEWYRCDRKQQRAKYAPCDQMSGSSGNTAPHSFAPRFQLSVFVLEQGLNSLLPKRGGRDVGKRPNKIEL